MKRKWLRVQSWCISLLVYLKVIKPARYKCNVELAKILAKEYSDFFRPGLEASEKRQEYFALQRIAYKMADVFMEYFAFDGKIESTWGNNGLDEDTLNDFEERFKPLVCELKGEHDMIPDQCGIKGHYFCHICSISQAELDGVSYGDCK